MISISLKLAIRYVLYSLVLFIALYGVLYIEGELKRYMDETYNLYPYLFYPLLYIILGILLGSPIFLQERSKPGSWSLQIEKLVFVGIPTLYISLYPLITFKVHILMLPRYFNVLILTMNPSPVTALIFGYILMTSVEKKLKAKEK